MQSKKRHVAHDYDRNSKSFLAGAWKHWPEDRRSAVARRMEHNDRLILKYARERRGL
jgi:hypothetical protein